MEFTRYATIPCNQCERKPIVTEPARAAQIVAAVSKGSTDSLLYLPFHQLIKLYSAFQPSLDGSGWCSVKAVCLAHPDIARRVDMRAFVQLGLLNGILRTVHMIPMKLEFDATFQEPLSRQYLSSCSVPNVDTLTDGHHDMDEICCLLSATLSDAQREIVSSCGPCAYISL